MHRRPLPFACPVMGIASLLILSIASTSAFATICRVKTDGAGGVDGSDWDSHALVLNAALAKPECIGPGNEIWVKQGVYRAATDIMFRDLSISIPAGAQVYGGFAGIETLRTQRDPDSYPTIFSGDIADDDVDGNNDGIIDDGNDINGSNNMHVVLLDGNTTPITTDTVLDGLVITAGQAVPIPDPGGVPTYGGGILCQADASATSECSPTLANLRLIGNRASSAVGGGGGAFSCIAQAGGHCGPVISNSLISGNRATSGAAINIGAALYAPGDIPSFDLTLNNSRLSDNHAVSSGGAMAFVGVGAGVDGSLTITGSEFFNNLTDSSIDTDESGGGALIAAALYGASLTLAIGDSAFNGNQVGTYGSGGGILAWAVEGTINATLERLGFAENTANGDGGGLYLRSSAYTNSSQTDLSCNNAGTPSGSASLQVSIGNVTFSSNAASNGGGVTLVNGPDCSLDATFANVTAAGNVSSASEGGGIRYLSTTPSNLNVINSILWNNTASGEPQLGTAGSTTPNVTRSVVDDGCPSLANCSLIDASDPMLSGAGDHGGVGFTYLPDPAGSAVDAGDDTVCASAPVDGVDQRGVTRPPMGCDIGAVEYRFDSVTLNVSVTGPGTVDANTPPTPDAGGIAGCTESGVGCSADYLGESVAFTPIQLSATPGSGHHVEWGGDCAADGSVMLDASKTCTATFVTNIWGIGGSISGLGANGLILSLSADGGNIFEAIAPTSGSTVFAFAADVPFDADYAVSINNQPAGHSCQINNASGTMPDADVNDVQVVCTPSPEIFANGFE